MQVDDIDAQKLKMESNLREGVSPRIPGAGLHVVDLASKETHVFLHHVPRSLLAPHRIVFKDHEHFYSRNSAGKYRLDVSESRSAFTLSAAVAEQVRAFHTDRLSRISGNDATSVSIDARLGKIVLHLVHMKYNPSTSKD